MERRLISLAVACKHLVRMHLSKKYALNFEVQHLLIRLGKEIWKCDHTPAPEDKIRSILSKLLTLDPTQWIRAANALANGNNFFCKELAISIDSSIAKKCADSLMGVAREHLKLCGHMDRACWARRRLVLARNWYVKGGALTPVLEDEISVGLKKTAWVSVDHW